MTKFAVGVSFAINQRLMNSLITIWCVEKIMKLKGTLAVEGVGEDAQGGFVALADVAACVESRTAEALEPADEAFNVPASSIAVGFERAFGHLRTVEASQRAVGTVRDWFDHAAHAPYLAADAVNPIGIIARVRQQRFGQMRASRAKGLLQQLGGLAFVVVRPPVEHETQRQQTAAYHAQGYFEILGSPPAAAAQ